METKTIVIPTNDVSGNITSCKFERILSSIEKKSAFSFTQTDNYTTYSVCTGEVIEINSIPSFTEIGGFVSLIGFLVFVTFVVMTLEATCRYYSKRR